MAIADDFVWDVVNKRVYNKKALGVDGTTTVYIVQDLYRYAMDYFDEEGVMPDDVPMSAQTPVEYTMINGWFIDNESTKYLKTGAIKTVGYTGQIQVVPMKSSGYTPCVLTDIGLTVHNVAETDYGKLIAYNNTTRKWWVRGTVQLPDETAYHVHGGSGIGTSDTASATGEDLFSGVFTLGAVEAGSLVYIAQAGVKLDPDWWDVGFIDILVKVQEADVAIGEGKITLHIREWTDLDDHYEIDLSPGGRSPVSLAVADDLDNTTTIATVKDYLDKLRIWFVNWKIDYDGKTGDDPAVGEVVRGSTGGATGFIVEWSTTTLKLANKKGAFADNEPLTILTKLKFDGQVLEFAEGDAINGQTSAATGTVRRVEQFGTVGVLWLSDVTGVWQDNENIRKNTTVYAVVDGTADPSTFSALVNITNEVLLSIDKDLDNGNGPQPYNVIIDMNGRAVKELYEFVKAVCVRGTQIYDCFPVWDGANILIQDGEQYQAFRSTYPQKKPSPFGIFAGGKFFGARGVWIEDMVVTEKESFSLIDALGATQAPPVTATLKVIAMIASVDRCLMCESISTGSSVIKKNQYTMTTQALGVEYVQVVGAIADDAPATGKVRVVYNYGLPTQGEDIYTYTSIDRSPANDKFITAATGRAYDTTTDKAYNPYLDTLSNVDGEAEQAVKWAQVTKYIVTRVRKKGYIPFQVTGSFAAAGISVTAIRTEDPIGA